jgi:hypothetical protein
MDFVETIADKYNKCIRQRCEEEGCRIGFRGMPKHICLKGEKLTTKSICDCLLFYLENNEFISAAIELKSGSWGLAEISEQLSNGSQMIEKMLDQCDIEIDNTGFYPILMHIKGPQNTSEKKKFRQTKIKFKHIQYSLLPHRCGTEFLEIRRLRKGI